MSDIANLRWKALRLAMAGAIFTVPAKGPLRRRLRDWGVPKRQVVVDPQISPEAGLENVLVTTQGPKADLFQILDDLKKYGIHGAQVKLKWDECTITVGPSMAFPICAQFSCVEYSELRIKNLRRLIDERMTGIKNQLAHLQSQHEALEAALQLPGENHGS